MSYSSWKLNRNLIVLHLTVLVWGFTGLLGALISIPALHLVWYRVLIAFVTLFAYFKASGTQIKVDKISFIRLFCTGAIVGLHWILFFHSIKLSTVSVTLVCLSSLTLFTAILEPVLTRRKVSKLEVLSGLTIVSGICLIFHFETKYAAGIVCGLSSALAASLFSIINSKQIKKRPAAIISFYELFGAWLWISLYLLSTEGFTFPYKLTVYDFSFLLILGTICTSVAYVAGVSVMRELSAFRVALVTNLEPIYGIILAFIFLGKREIMSTGFYFGSALILFAVFFYPYALRLLKARQNR